jgi:hypothetical protein
MLAINSFRNRRIANERKPLTFLTAPTMRMRTKHFPGIIFPAKPSLEHDQAGSTPVTHAYNLPSFAIVMEPKHAHQLLEMIVEHCVVNARIDVIQRVGSDRVARVNVQRNTCGGEKSRRGARVAHQSHV